MRFFVSHAHFILITILTLFGLLPLQVLVFGSQVVFLAGQFLGFSYVAILLSFLAGVHWAYGLMLRNWILQLSSVVLSLAPWFALLMQKLDIIKELETVWTLILLDTMILLLIDYHYLNKQYDKRYLQLRCVATGLLMLTIIVIILRHIAISKFS